MKRKTSSLWGRPPARYYRFLNLAEQRVKGPLRMAVLGCSDGKFVLPAARRGHTVFAIDIDEIALFGGPKLGPEGEIIMPGLTSRLKAEALVERVTVVHGDFVEHPPLQPCDAVFTSGAIQYSRNLIHALSDVVSAIQAYVAPGGYLYIDYMLPLKPHQSERENFPSREKWSTFFSAPAWDLLYNRVLPPVFERAHVDNPVDHFHHWGHLLVRRL
jgi:SAM-dependent methyltransferase